MKHKILIDINSAKGHFNATLKIANLLKNNDYEVIYGTGDILKDDIERNGFIYYNFKSIRIFKINLNINKNRIKDIFIYFNFLFNNKKYKNAKKNIIKYQEDITKINPDLVLLDEQSAIKSIFYEKLGIKILLFQTKPDTRKIKGIPPFTFYYLPKNNKINYFYCEFLWLLKMIKSKIKYYYNKILSLGQDNLSILKKISKDLNVNFSKRITFKRSFGVGIKNIPRLIISPSDFDFPHEETENIFRIGPLVDINRFEDTKKYNCNNLLYKLETDITYKNKFIIYCSLGTVLRNYRKEVKIFLEKIIDVAKLNPDYIFIISKSNIEFNNITIPKNVFCYNYVPQLSILKHSNLMITHGGMNSITECVLTGVPILVYPLSNNWDQPGNSARIIYHKIGLRGKLKKDSIKTISKKINDIKSNYTYYKKNILTLQDKYNAKNNSTEILNIINNFLKDVKIKNNKKKQII